jgi:hypothetical protein
MELLIALLLIAVYLLYFSFNYEKLNPALVGFSSVLFLILGVYILFSGDLAFSISHIETYTYTNGTLTSMTSTPIANNTNYDEYLGFLCILSSLYFWVFSRPRN